MAGCAAVRLSSRGRERFARRRPGHHPDVKKIAAAVLIGVALFAGRAVMKTYAYRLRRAAKKGPDRLKKKAPDEVTDVASL